MANESGSSPGELREAVLSRVLKPGFASTEFWVVVALFVVGVVLIEKGHEGIGAALLSIAGVSYKVSRTLLKGAALSVVALALVLTCGCSTQTDAAIRVVREGRALLRHPEPGDGDWETRRLVFLADANKVDPDPRAEREGAVK